MCANIRRAGVVAFVVGVLLRGWKLVVSPLFGERCRFYPTCSEYAAEAVLTHGIVKGLYLATWRLLRCHPFSKGGIDAVPEGRRDVVT